MTRTLDRWYLVVACFVLGSCTEPQHASVTEWLGPQLHGEIRGEIDDVRVDVIAGATRVACKREYAVPSTIDAAAFGKGRLDEIEVSFYVTIDGVSRHYEIELYDFTDVAVGQTLTAVPEVSDGEIGPNETHVEFEWEWESDHVFFRYAGVATGGTIEIRELSGMVGPDGLVIPAGEGNFGALVQLELPDGEVGLSFTAPCAIVELEPMK